MRKALRVAVPVLLLAGTAAPAWAQPELSGTLVVTNKGDHTATILDAESGTVLATLPTGRGPHEVAVSHDGRWAVATNYGVRGAPGNSLTVFDLETLEVKRTIDLGEHQRPHGAAFLPDDSLLAVTSEASQAVLLVDIANAVVVGTMPTQQAASHMLALVPDGSRIYTTNIRDGTLTELDVASRASLRVMPVAPVVEGLAVTPTGDEVWVGSNEDKTVSVFNVERGEVAAELAGFGFPYRISITPDGALAIVADPVRSEVWLFDVATREERARVSVSDTAGAGESPSPQGITISRDGQVAYVTLGGRDQVAAIDLETASILATMPTGAEPDGIGYSPLTR
jgi:DNA-binding beta-propeller fold protein YncE